MLKHIFDMNRYANAEAGLILHVLNNVLWKVLYINMYVNLLSFLKQCLMYFLDPVKMVGTRIVWQVLSVFVLIRYAAVGGTSSA
jgi:hypothetical protein